MIKARNRDLNMFFQLTKRHLIVFFRSKITVLYTLIVPVIVLIIYILFLRELEFSSVRAILQDLNISTNDNPELIKHLGAVIDSWMLSGICAVTSVTVSIQTNYIFVRDKDSGINRDFLSSPVKGPILIGSYFLSSFIITLLIIIIHIGKKLKLCRDENFHINVLVLAYNINLENKKKKEEKGKRIKLTFGWIAFY